MKISIYSVETDELLYSSSRDGIFSDTIGIYYHAEGTLEQVSAAIKAIPAFVEHIADQKRDGSFECRIRMDLDKCYFAVYPVLELDPVAVNKVMQDIRTGRL